MREAARMTRVTRFHYERDPFGPGDADWRAINRETGEYVCTVRYERDARRGEYWGVVETLDRGLFWNGYDAMGATRDSAVARYLSWRKRTEATDARE